LQFTSKVLQGSAIIADGFDGTFCDGLLAALALLVVRGLFVDVTVTAFFIALKIGGRCLAAKITVNTLRIDVKRAFNIA